jgi:short-subunit dehydrogenase
MQREGRRVLITGAGSGIGRALAMKAAARGCTVALCGRRQDALEETASLLPNAGSHLIVPADIRHASDRARIVTAIGEAWGHLDVLVNNAGIVPSGDLASLDDDLLSEVFATNVVGPIALTRDLIPLLRKGKTPSVLNIGSVFGEIPFPGFVAYSASKGAVKAFSIGLRREVQRLGISVTYVAPRATDTAAALSLSALKPSARPKLDSPERIAATAWEAMERRRRTAYAKGPERFFILLQTLFPRLVDTAVSRST